MWNSPHTSEKEFRRVSLAIVFNLAFCLWMFWPVLFQHKESFFVFTDNVQQFYPWYQKLASSLHMGYLPLWDANAFSGYSFPGVYQTGVFYPLNLIWCYFFGSTKGISVESLEALVCFHYFLASVGFYFLCKEWRLSNFPSVLAGLVYAYSGAVLSRAAAQVCIFYGLCLLPWALWLTFLYFRAGKKRFLVLTGLVLALQVLAGHLQPFFHTSILLVCFAGFRVWKETNGTAPFLAKISQLLIWIYIPFVVFSLPQNAFGLYQLEHAYRWVGSVNPIGPGQTVPYTTFAYKYSFSVSDFLNLISPEFLPPDDNQIFFGILPLFLVTLFLSCPTLRRSEPFFQEHRWLLAILYAATVFILLGHDTFVAALLYFVPMVADLSRQLGRYAIVLHFLNCLLFGLAFNAIWKQRHEWQAKFDRSLRIMSVLLFAEVAYLWCEPMLTDLLHQDRSISTTRVLVSWSLVAVCVTALLYVRRRRLVGLLVGLCVVTELAVHAPRFIPNLPSADDARTAFRATPVIDYLEPYYGSARVDIRDHAIPENIGDVYRIQTKGGWGATMYKPYFDFLSRAHNIGSKVNDLLNVRFIVAKKQLHLKLLLHDTERNVYLYERPHYLPRVFTKQELVSRPLQDSSFSFRVLKYEDLYEKFQITTAKQQDVIFSEIRYPGWHAYVDGVPTPIQSANVEGSKGLFRMIRLPPGYHIVEFKYL